MDILFEKIDVLDPETGFIPDMYVAVRGSSIVSVSAGHPGGSFDRVITGSYMLMIPGLVNSHAHSAMTLMRGYGENLVLSKWLETRIFPFEAKLTGDDVYYGTLLAMAESFRYGVVSSTDMYAPLPDMARAYIDCGAKANISNPFTSFDQDLSIRDIGSYRQNHETRDLLSSHTDGRVVIDTGLHAEYTATDKILRETAEYAKENNFRVHVHISETKKEHDEGVSRRGVTPARWMYEGGLFDSPTTAAHCVWITEDDICLLAEKGVTIASNPVSNLKLASGVADVPAFRKAGINVSVGTDGAASNNSLNLLSDMKYYALVNKERRCDPTVITPMETLYAATRAGYLSQGRDDCGRIAEGYKADLAIFDTSLPGWCPSYDPARSLIYAADGGDVAMTLVDGRIVYERGSWPTIDIEKVKFEARASVSRILGELDRQ